MASSIKKGFPQVPRLTNRPLGRFLSSMRTAAIELQQLSVFFAGLSGAQQSQLINTLRRLAEAETAVADQVQTIDGMRVQLLDQSQLISQLTDENTLQEQVINDLLTRVDALEGP